MKIINHVLSMTVVVLVVRITLLKPIIMQKLDGMNIIVQLKVKNHQNAFKTISTNVLHCLLFQMLQKMLRPGRTQRHHILLYGNLILTKNRTLKDWFYLEMVSHRPINDIIQTPQKEMHFFLFSVCCIVIDCS